MEEDHISPLKSDAQMLEEECSFPGDLNTIKTRLSDLLSRWSKRCMKETSGSLVVDEKEIRDMWKKYLENLMKKTIEWDYWFSLM